ncbi:hypothetical protein E5170_20035 [Pseudomonas atacamensis]|uniref:Uncharacterized protein n=1 Tax=Pseudomonas atacamensis TaxID=2565368 RepID=A0AAQ2DAJ8_9PSED|nr:hypothetical protein E5170_20035 [Pseudomonas atacamensis]
MPIISVGESLLAKADCQAMTMSNVPPPSRAGSLPQGFWLLWRWSIYPYQCGSEPARESAVSGNDDVDCAAAFASKLAPTGTWVAMKMVDLPRISVGASLLAKAQCHAMTMLTVPATSRAGSLPQVLAVYSKSR